MKASELVNLVKTTNETNKLILEKMSKIDQTNEMTKKIEKLEKLVLALSKKVKILSESKIKKSISENFDNAPDPRDPRSRVKKIKDIKSGKVRFSNNPKLNELLSDTYINKKDNNEMDLYGLEDDEMPVLSEGLDFEAPDKAAMVYDRTPADINRVPAEIRRTVEHNLNKNYSKLLALSKEKDNNR